MVPGFEQAHDYLNMGLLLCNMGRLVRVGVKEGSGAELSDEEIAVHRKSIAFYQRAQECIKKAPSLNADPLPEVYPRILESVNQEVARVKFNFASLLQDYPPLSRIPAEDLEKETTNTFLEAVRFYEGEVSKYAKQLQQHQYHQQLQPEVSSDRNSLLSLTNERIANIHHRLASLHHNSLAQAEASGRGASTRQIKMLAENHYQKALLVYTPEAYPFEYLKIHLELARLQESGHQQADSLPLKQATTTLDLLLKGRLGLPLGPPAQFEERITGLATILETKVQMVLRELIKLYSAKKNAKKTEVFKRLYSQLLTGAPSIQGLRGKLDLLARAYDADA